jgi:hypothetical protein
MDAAGIALIQGTLRKRILRTFVGWELTVGDFPGQRNAGLPAPDYVVDQPETRAILSPMWLNFLSVCAIVRSGLRAATAGGAEVGRLCVDRGDRQRLPLGCREYRRPISAGRWMTLHTLNTLEALRAHFAAPRRSKVRHAPDL